MAFKLAEAYVSVRVQNAKKTESRISKIGKSFKAMGPAAAIGATAVGVAFVGIVKSAADAGDEIHKMAARTGASTEALSELGFAAEQSGASLQSVEVAMKDMGQRVLDMSNGSQGAIDLFSQIGIEAKDLEGLNTEDQFTKVADALSKIEDPAKRSALTMKIMGKQGRALGPLFEGGAEGIAKLREEAVQLGRSISQEEANAAAEFGDSINEMKSVFGGIVRSIGSAVIPTLTKILDYSKFVINNWSTLWDIAQERTVLFAANSINRIKAFAENVVVLGGWILDNWRDVLSTLSSLVTNVFKNVSHNIQAALVPAQTSIAALLIKAHGLAAGLSKEEIDQRLEINEDIGRRRQKPMRNLLDGFKSEIKEMPKFVEAAVDSSTPELDRLQGELNKAFAESFTEGPGVKEQVAESFAEAAQEATQVASESLSGDTGQAASGKSGALALVDSIQQSVLGKGADLTKKSNELLQKLVEQGDEEETTVAVAQ